MFVKQSAGFLARQLIPKTIATQATWNSRIASRYYSSEAINADGIAKMVKNNKVVVFMKGIPDAPKCGFSNAVVQILRMHGVQYDSHDVLANDSVRQEIKNFTNWPTIPQVFIDGEFVGGCDIVLQMHQNGELIEELKKVGITSNVLKEHLDKKPDGDDKTDKKSE